jgi:hypothetical protein
MRVYSKNVINMIHSSVIQYVVASFTPQIRHLYLQEHNNITERRLTKLYCKYMNCFEHEIPTREIKVRKLFLSLGIMPRVKTLTVLYVSSTEM